MLDNRLSIIIFLNNVRWLRKHYGLSKKLMADIMGISIYSINEIEKGKLPPKMSVVVVFNLQRYFGIEASKLVSVLLCNTFE